MRGPFKTQILRITHFTTVQGIKNELRRRHLINDPTERRSHYITSAIQRLPLGEHDPLQTLGIEEGMTLHVHTHILGGAIIDILVLVSRLARI